MKIFDRISRLLILVVFLLAICATGAAKEEEDEEEVLYEYFYDENETASYEKPNDDATVSTVSEQTDLYMKPPETHSSTGVGYRNAIAPETAERVFIEPIKVRKNIDEIRI